MKKQLLFFAYIMCALIVFSGCEKTYSGGEVTVYGTVVDEDTGNPVPVAEISISIEMVTPISTVTGSDGTYEFIVPLPKGSTYLFEGYIQVEKSKYCEVLEEMDLTMDMVGKKIQRSFKLNRY